MWNPKDPMNELLNFFYKYLFNFIKFLSVLSLFKHILCTIYSFTYLSCTRFVNIFVHTL